MSLKEFFGFGGYTREPEGYMSWEHLTFVTSLMVVMVLLAVMLGRRFKNRAEREKNRVLIVTALLIDALELFKIVMLCIINRDPMHWVNLLPLFLCSIQLIAIPLAAFSSGRLKQACLDFVMIFGLLGAVMGTYFAGQNYGCYPVISLDNVVSGLTHSISGFASLYIMFAKMTDMKKKNIPLTTSILAGFCVAAYIANVFNDCNYMFLSRGDGTPYDIVYNLVGGNQILYPLSVVALFVIYIVAYYFVFYAVTKRSKPTANPEESTQKELETV